MTSELEKDLNEEIRLMMRERERVGKSSENSETCERFSYSAISKKIRS